MSKDRSNHNDISFWGWENLASSKRFVITMDADSSKITIRFLKLSKYLGIHLNLNYKELKALTKMLKEAQKKSKSKEYGILSRDLLGEIEKLGKDSFALLINNTTYILENSFNEFCEIVKRANYKILKLR